MKCVVISLGLLAALALYGFADGPNTSESIERVASAAALAPVGSGDVDTAVVCPDEFLPAAQAWIQYRQRQGHRLAVISTVDSPAVIKQALQRLHQRSPLRFVVILGDAGAKAARGGGSVPTERVQSDVIRQWGAESTFASDHGYADLGGDGRPDVALGRICADTAPQLAKTLARVMAYERNPNVGFWRRRVNFVAGVGGFGFLADKVLETAAKKFITDGIPAGYQTSMTQASWHSAYSPDPRLFQAQTIERLNQGCLAWIYLGHGQERGLDYYRVPDGGVPIFTTKEIPRVRVRNGAPIAVFLSCYTGAFAEPQDCLAEQLQLANGGPVAVISGASVTMPYAMTVMGNAMLDALFRQKQKTLGEVLLFAKQTLVQPVGDQPKVVDQLARLISPQPERLADERAEHVRLFHLFGDPMMRIRQPQPIEVTAPEYGTCGTEISVSGSSPLDGPCLIELICRRDRLTFTGPRRPRFEFDDKWLSSLQETYRRANNTTWTSLQSQVVEGKFQAKLAIPEDALGPAHVRVYIQTERDFAIGSADVHLRRPIPAEQNPPAE